MHRHGMATSESSSSLVLKEQDENDDSFHRPYTESAILIESMSTPSYCRSDASPRSFLFPLSSDIAMATEDANVHHAVRIIERLPRHDVSNSSITSGSTTSTLFPNTVLSSSYSTNPWSNSYSKQSSSDFDSVSSFELPAVTDNEDDGYEESSYAQIMPPVTMASESGSKPPPFYYDEASYEEHVNIWASRVWTSGSGKEDDLETFLQAMDKARAQLSAHQEYASSQSTAMLHAIEETTEAAQTLSRGHLSSTVPLVAPSLVASSLSSGWEVGPAPPPLSLSTTSPSILSPILVAKLHSSGLRWFDQVFLLPHEPLRRALRKVRRFVTLEHMPVEAAESKKAAFFSWFDQLRLYVQTQCHIKSTVLKAIIVGVNPHMAQVLDATTHSYPAVLEIVDAVVFFQSHHAVNDDVDPLQGWASFVLQLAEYLSTLEHVLLAMLDRDEIDFGHALASTFDEESYARLVQKKIEVALPNHAKRVIVPWMLESCNTFGGSTEHWQWGWWSKWLLEHSWRKYYEANVVAPLHVLEFGHL
ncbi:hypothetical protein LEN26_000986 [Aphanomyces euteiches]|nr:hypothetical protein AeMF1_021542 [Aphanomyces euteiches]KAH9162339.1 hypothetical protein LEN26_000986 [Aphanomyces euteiches]KAH9190545.1 hypothetical protein AeNC1_007481 [Aphanomyces euteiches]